MTTFSCADGELSEQEAEQVVAESVSVMVEVATCQFDLDVAITIKMTGGGRPGEIETTATGAGAIDKANRQIQVIVNGTAAIGGAGIGALSGLFSSDRSMIGGAIGGAGWGVGLFGAGVGAARLYGRYGRYVPGLASAAWGRASAFGRRITQAINPMRGIHVM